MKSIYIAFMHAIFMLSADAKWQSSFKWLANGCMAVSALIVSFSPEYSQYSVAFIGFLLGHILWTMSAISMKDIPLITLNVGFLPVDLYAMYIRL